MYSERVSLKGHLIDTLLLTRVLDEIIAAGGTYEIEDMKIGVRKDDPSSACLKIMAPGWEQLRGILQTVAELGAAVAPEDDAVLVPAPRDGVFPRGFYATTNLETWVRVGGDWLRLENEEMDCGVVVDLAAGKARAVRLGHVRQGDMVVTGHQGVRVIPLERPRSQQVFEFMASSVSSEKPKRALVASLAEEIRGIKARGGKVLVVSGPALIHTNSGRYLSELIERGFVDVVFGGNALATHDIEAALYGTSLGVSLEEGEAMPDGHEHHLRAINTIRDAGSIRSAVEKGILRSGLMYTLTVKGVPYVLAGSIRDDGPLPEVITDVREAQDAMRSHLQGVEMVISIATMLHSIATGNILPARVRFVCVDINPAVVTKLADRGSFQSTGVVTDVESFMRELTRQLIPLS